MNKTIKAVIENIVLIILIITTVVVWSNISYHAGYKKGFDACIEENNLYNRYERSE